MNSNLSDSFEQALKCSKRSRGQLPPDYNHRRKLQRPISLLNPTSSTPNDLALSALNDSASSATDEIESHANGDSNANANTSSDAQHSDEIDYNFGSEFDYDDFVNTSNYLTDNVGTSAIQILRGVDGSDVMDDSSSSSGIVTERIDDDIVMTYVFGNRPKAIIDLQSQYMTKINDQLSGNIQFKKYDVSH